jgi:hypothetical protein
MLIPFPILRKLQVNTSQRIVLIVIFCLPIIPIIFAILRLVETNPNKSTVDAMGLPLFSMLENTFDKFFNGH